ncbi:serine hydrolase [Dyadobacter beijingensis]|uniref:serine hydrolase n=1 Tax=Dyadobacter beijingensis TaxID=365489 RepID=UPI000527B9A3|nr:serine hydrolase domain-containing protein [Dyadobacter beijingensis]
MRLLCGSVYAQSPEAKIDSLFLFYSAEKPGGQLAVSRHGKVIYSKAWGMADLPRNVRLTEESLIEAGSVSKQFTAAEDLLKWNDFYLSEKMGGQTVYRKQIALDTLGDGTVSSYAAGLFIDNRAARKPVFFHGGATNAYRAKLIASPAEGLSIAWLSNTSMLDSTGIDPAAAVFDLLTLPDEAADDKARPANTVKIDPATLKSYAGFYKSAQSARDVEITLGPQGLMLSETPLEPVNARQFRFYGIKLAFDRAGELTITPPAGEPMQYYQVDPTADNAPLDHYTGAYFSEEVGGIVEIQKHDQALKIKLASGAIHPLESYARDRFLIPEIKAGVVFKRTRNGAVDALELSTPRSLRILFQKQAPPSH